MPVTSPGPEHHRSRGKLDNRFLTPSPPSKRPFDYREPSEDIMISESKNEVELRTTTNVRPKELKPERSGSPENLGGSSCGTSVTAYEPTKSITATNITTPERSREKWGDRYKQGPASNIPQYRSPRGTNVRTKLQLNMNRKPGIFNSLGAAKPVNRLGSQNGTRSPGETSKTSKKRDKAFDLTGSPAKKPKLSNNLMTQQKSSGKISIHVNLDEDDDRAPRLDRPTQNGLAPPSQEHSSVDLAFGVQEYNTVERTVGDFGTQKRKYPRPHRYGKQNGKNRDSDFFEVERSQIAPVTSGYKGTANHKPARPHNDRYGQLQSRSNSVESSITSGTKSPYFDDHTQQGQPGRRGSTASSAQNFFHAKSEREPDQDIPKNVYEDEDSLDPISDEFYPRETKKKSSSIMAPYQKSKASSKSADISHTQFANGNRSRTIANSKARLAQPSVINVVYALAGTREIPCGFPDKLLELRPNHENNAWVPFCEKIESDDFPELTIKPAAINKITYNDDSSKIYIVRATSTQPQVSRSLCLELGDGVSSGRLVQQIQKLNGNINIDNTGDDPSKMDKIFETQKSVASKQLGRTSRSSGSYEAPEDLQLVESRIRRQGEKNYMHSVETPTNNFLYSQSSQYPEQPDPQEQHPNTQPARKLDTLRRENFSDSQLDVDAARPRRREALRTRSAVQQARTPSPEPKKWTIENPGWKQTYWTGPSHLELQYPFDDKNKAVVAIDDIHRLDDNEELNDNLVVFYLRVLEYNLQKSNPELAKRVYFNNSFFYNALTGSGKPSRGISYEAVQRWTSKVNIFTYDYIIVPVCEEHHWYVAIICNAPRLISHEVDQKSAPPEDDDGAETSRKPSENTSSPNLDIAALCISNESSKDDYIPISEGDLQGAKIGPTNKADNQNPFKPSTFESKKGKRRVSSPRKFPPKDTRIVTLDSLNESRSTACVNLKDWLVAEAKDKLGQRIFPERLGMTAKGLPRQGNYTDCGVFLLAYIEQFLKDPDTFIHEILEGKRDLEKGWGDWTEQKIPELRRDMRDMIFKFRREFITLKKREKIAKREKQKIQKKLDEAQKDGSEATTSTLANERASSAALPQNPDLSEEQVNSSDTEQAPPHDQPYSTIDTPGEDFQAQPESSSNAPVGQRSANNGKAAKGTVEALPLEPAHEKKTKESLLDHKRTDGFTEIGSNAFGALRGGDRQKRKEICLGIKGTPEPDNQGEDTPPEEKRLKSPTKDVCMSSEDAGVANGPPVLLSGNEDDLVDRSKNVDGPGSIKTPYQLDGSQDIEITDHLEEQLALQKKSFSEDRDELIFTHSSQRPKSSNRRVAVNKIPLTRPGSSRVAKRNRDQSTGPPLRSPRDGITMSPPRSTRSSTQPSSPIHKKTKNNSSTSPIDLLD